MKPKTKEKLARRLRHLSEVLSDALKEDQEDVVALIALYHTVRDIQPGLCEALGELSEDTDWYSAYADEMLSDQEQHEKGEFLWPEEMKPKRIFPGGGHGSSRR